MLLSPAFGIYQSLSGMDSPNMRTALSLAMAVIGLMLPATGVLAAPGPAGHGHGGAPAALLGEPAPRGQDRPVPIVVTDFAYGLKTVTVKVGETIRVHDLKQEHCTARILHQYRGGARRAPADDGDDDGAGDDHA